MKKITRGASFLRKAPPKSSADAGESSSGTAPIPASAAVGREVPQQQPIKQPGAAAASSSGSAAGESEELRRESERLRAENEALKGQVHLLKFKVDLLVDMVTLANLDCDKLEDEVRWSRRGCGRGNWCPGQSPLPAHPDLRDATVTLPSLLFALTFSASISRHVCSCACVAPWLDHSSRPRQEIEEAGFVVTCQRWDLPLHACTRSASVDATQRSRASQVQVGPAGCEQPALACASTSHSFHSTQRVGSVRLQRPTVDRTRVACAVTTDWPFTSLVNRYVSSMNNTEYTSRAETPPHSCPLSQP